MPSSFNTLSFSSVMLSGRPASTVNSATSSTGNTDFIFCMSWRNCSADKVVGVPPPI